MGLLFIPHIIYKMESHGGMIMKEKTEKLGSLLT
jgi:hypothetical protein